MYSPTHPDICLDLAVYGNTAIRHLCEEILSNMLDDEFGTAKNKLHLVVLTQTVPRLHRLCRIYGWTDEELSKAEEKEPEITQSITDHLADFACAYAETSEGVGDADEWFLNKLFAYIKGVGAEFEKQFLLAVEAKE